MIQRVPFRALRAFCFQPLVLADGDEFHLGRDHTLARVPQLGDGMRLRRPQGFAPEPGEFQEPIAFGLAREFSVLLRKITVVHRLDAPAVVFGDVAPRADPRSAQRG